MRKSVKLILLILIFFIILGISLFNIFNSNKTNNIDTILKSKYYSYLPLEAKNYIKEVYEETGELILTEKNKEENLPYLNPQYAEYLSLENEEQIKYGYIPSSTIVDYVYGTTPITESFEETFDLRNVDGMNFVTPVQNQHGGLCWAYSSTAQIEGLLLINNNVSYSNSSTIFSERQLDYATSKDGIVGDNTLYPYRYLYDEGGAYFWPWSVEVDGLGLVDINWQKEIENSTEKLEANKVYNFSNSIYEVDNTIDVPKLNLKELDENSETDMKKRKEYLDTIKGIVKKYGGAVAGSINPTGRC